jgi:hypothetical protein
MGLLSGSVYCLEYAYDSKSRQTYLLGEQQSFHYASPTEVLLPAHDPVDTLTVADSTSVRCFRAKWISSGP